MKHDFFHQFSRPRVDLVIHILASQLIPTVVNTMKTLLNNLRKVELGGDVSTKDEPRLQQLFKLAKEIQNSLAQVRDERRC